MLPRKSLVDLKHEFPHLRKEGKIYDSASFGLLVDFHGSGGPKVAFVVSKKIDNRSVIRHEVKRKLAEAVTPFMGNFSGNLEAVFLAKGKAAQRTLLELQAEIEAVLRRAKLL